MQHQKNPYAGTEDINENKKEKVIKEKRSNNFQFSEVISLHYHAEITLQCIKSVVLKSLGKLVLLL